MAEAKWKSGGRARYEGIVTARRGQEVDVEVDVEIVWAGGLVACRFPDGAVIGCAPGSLRAA